ncbi:MAG: DUF433 domain-containing protein [Chloroflexota bacterium]|nr:DUF433 domain-containing protein [Chloroflexota bacterium]
MNSLITINPNVRLGKPCITGTRITVYEILELLRDGATFSEITTDYYEGLQVEDLQACIQYALDVVRIEDLHVSVVPA